jgi:hypothetical protein
VGLQLQVHATLIIRVQASGGDSVADPARQLTPNSLITGHIVEVFAGNWVVFEHPGGSPSIRCSSTANRISQAGRVVGVMPTTENACNHAEQEEVTAGFRSRL